MNNQPCMVRLILPILMNFITIHSLLVRTTMMRAATLLTIHSVEYIFLTKYETLTLKYLK